MDELSKYRFSSLQLKFLLSILFLIWPFGGACIAFVFLLNRQYKKGVIFLISLFCGLFGYTFIPDSTMDVLKHYNTYEELQSISTIQDFFLFGVSSEKPDFLLDILYWIIGRSGVSYQIIGFLSAFFFYFMIIKIADRWISSLGVKEYRLGLILLLGSFLSLTPIYEFSGMRNGNAILLFLYIITNPNSKKGLKLIILLFCTCLIHFSMYPIVLLYLLSIYLKRKNILLIALTLSLGVFLFFPIMQMIMYCLGSIGGIGLAIAAKIESYLFLGENESALYSGSVLRFIFVCGLLPLIIVLWFKKDKERTNLSSFFLRLHYFLILFIAYLVFSVDSYILSRNLMLFKYLAVLYLVFVFYKSELSKPMRRLLLTINLMILAIGFSSVILGKEYRAINPTLFSSNFISILQVRIPLEGYEYN